MSEEDEHICPECGYHQEHMKSWRQPGERLVTIIGFWPVEERGHMGFDNRWISRCHYRTACAHAHWDLQIIEEPGQALIPEGVPVISVEEPYPIEHRDMPNGIYNSPTLEPGTDIQCMEEFMHPASATYILGNTFYQRPSDYFEFDHKIGIMMDDPEIASYSPLYGSQMATMIWYDRRLKGS